MVEYGEETKRDLVRARSLYERACEGGHPRGCTNLGLMYEQAKGTPKDLPRALQYYRRACDAHDELACKHLSRAQKGTRHPRP
jgi:TPR repeat protein